MSKPINLNKVRKARAKAEKCVQADRNSVLYGLPKSARTTAKQEAERQSKDLDAKRRDKP